jgi:hypothetical protein
MNASGRTPKALSIDILRKQVRGRVGGLCALANAYAALIGTSKAMYSLAVLHAHAKTVMYDFHEDGERERRFRCFLSSAILSCWLRYFKFAAAVVMAFVAKA